jgi:hypothetical protein
MKSPSTTSSANKACLLTASWVQSSLELTLEAMSEGGLGSMEASGLGSVQVKVSGLSAGRTVATSSTERTLATTNSANETRLLTTSLVQSNLLWVMVEGLSTTSSANKSRLSTMSPMKSPSTTSSANKACLLTASWVQSSLESAFGGKAEGGLGSVQVQESGQSDDPLRSSTDYPMAPTASGM